MRMKYDLTTCKVRWKTLELLCQLKGTNNSIKAKVFKYHKKKRKDDLRKIPKKGKKSES